MFASLHHQYSINAIEAERVRVAVSYFNKNCTVAYRTRRHIVVRYDALPPYVVSRFSPPPKKRDTAVSKSLDDAARDIMLTTNS